MNNNELIKKLYAISVLSERVANGVEFLLASVLNTNPLGALTIPVVANTLVAITTKSPNDNKEIFFNFSITKSPLL